MLWSLKRAGPGIWNRKHSSVLQDPAVVYGPLLGLDLLLISTSINTYIDTMACAQYVTAKFRLLRPLDYV